MKALIVPTGTVFNRLAVTSELPRVRQPSGQLKRIFRFSCVCGKSVDALLDNVKSGKIQSCGCLNEENKTKHGLARHPLAKIWYGMHERCSDRENYAGRGISVCPEWSGDTGLSSFVAWAETQPVYMGLEVDRRDNDKGYFPDNCRFVTASVNQRNKQNALLVSHPSTGEQISLITLWETEGNRSLNWVTVRARYLYQNWSVTDSINKPKKGSNDC